MLTEEEGEEEEEEGLLKADAVNEDDRARPRYPGVEEEEEGRCTQDATPLQTGARAAAGTSLGPAARLQILDAPPSSRRRCCRDERYPLGNS